MQHMLYHLADNGRIGLVLAIKPAIPQQGTEESIFVKNIVNTDLVEGIIAMPSQLSKHVQIPCCLWFLSKEQSTTGQDAFHRCS